MNNTGPATVNRKHKDRLFRMIFGRDEYKDWLLGLFNDTLNLYEQQSTFHPNMPLRSFRYLSSLYSGYMAREGIDLYRTTQAKVPTSYCVCFCNGTMALEEAVDQAIDAMTADTVISPYLKSHRAEVKNVSIFEYNEAEHLRNTYEDGVTYGRKEGYNEGEKVGYDKGEKVGYDKGKKDGLTEAAIKTIRLMHRFGQPREAACQYLIDEFSLDSEQAEKYLEDYWPVWDSSV